MAASLLWVTRRPQGPELRRLASDQVRPVNPELTHAKNVTHRRPRHETLQILQGTRLRRAREGGPETPASTPPRWCLATVRSRGCTQCWHVGAGVGVEPSRWWGSDAYDLKNLDVPQATSTRPGLTTFTRLDDLGLEVPGQLPHRRTHWPVAAVWLPDACLSQPHPLRHPSTRGNRGFRPQLHPRLRRAKQVGQGQGQHRSVAGRAIQPSPSPSTFLKVVERFLVSAIQSRKASDVRNHSRPDFDPRLR